MNFEKSLKDLSCYNISFEIKEGYYHVSLVFKENWEIVSDNDLISIVNRNGRTHYIGATDSVTIDDIFKLINSTIDYNTDLELKLELFKETTQKLQELFANEKLEVLKTIQFKVTRKKEKAKTETPKKEIKTKKKTTSKKTRTTKKIKEENKLPKEEVTDETVDNNLISENNIYDEHYSDLPYEEEDDIVTMEDGYMEEAER